MFRLWRIWPFASFGPAIFPSKQVGDEIFNEIFHPIARRLVSHCDACLRIGGSSKGADEMVELAQKHGKLVFYRFEDIPPAVKTEDA
jgi:hypothetical protein